MSACACLQGCHLCWKNWNETRMELAGTINEGFLQSEQWEGMEEKKKCGSRGRRMREIRRRSDKWWGQKGRGERKKTETVAIYRCGKWGGMFLCVLYTVRSLLSVLPLCLLPPGPPLDPYYFWQSFSLCRLFFLRLFFVISPNSKPNRSLPALLCKRTKTWKFDALRTDSEVFLMNVRRTCVCVKWYWFREGFLPCLFHSQGSMRFAFQMRLRDFLKRHLSQK